MTSSLSHLHEFTSQPIAAAIRPLGAGPHRPRCPPGTPAQAAAAPHSPSGCWLGDSRSSFAPARFTPATDIQVYFCDPHSPWKRGSKENANGLLHQYLPKGTDLAKHTTADLRLIQRSLNDRPRKTLGYLPPSEAYAQVLPPTA